ncbi:MAG TPA: hypothetical protein VGS06_22830 [Streptosporangiaceae bacterium]|nr:hypothetical protein [Streptosporangiaceae bacterium]HEV2255994.1 hypothetical protein [Streptosporangiaceae bacterium]
MPKSLPALFCDVDGVLAFQPEGTILAVNARFGTSYLLADSASAYPFTASLTPGQQQWVTANKAVIAANLAPDTRAIRVLAKAAKAGYAVTIATERDPVLRDLTAAWLKYWQVPYGILAVVGPGNKGPLLDPYGKGNPAVLIDDDPAKEAFARPGVQVWVPPRPWTPQGKPPDGVTRFSDWREVCKQLGLKK